MNIGFISGAIDGVLIVQVLFLWLAVFKLRRQINSLRSRNWQKDVKE